MSAADAHLVEPWFPCVESHREWAELGARAVLVAGDDPDEARLTANYARLCEVMQPYGMTGTVKVQDVLVDLKVPRAERDRVPVVTCRDEIVWIPGYRIAQAWAVSGPSEPSVRVQVVHRCNHGVQW